MQRPIQPFSSGLALHFGQLGGIFSCVGLAGQRFAVAFQQVAEIGPDRRLQRAQDFVELDRGGGAADRDRAPLAISGALGLPGSSSMKKLPSRKIRGRISAKAS